MTFNIEQFLINNKIEYKISGKNVGRGEYGITCPFCGDNRSHCCINPIKQVFHCWVCSEAGNYEKLISKLKNISYTEAKEIVNLCNDLKKVLEERVNKMVQVIEKPMKNKELKLPPYTKPFIKDSTNIWQEVAYKFLVEKYDLSWKDILESDLHYCYFGEKYKNCIIIPCYFQNKLVTFIGRVWGTNSKKRYINCSNEEGLVNTKNLIYNYDNIRKGQNLVIVVEGVFDAIKVGLNRAVALFGTEITQTQLNLLAGLEAKRLIIMFDADTHITTTNIKAKKLSDYLSAFTKTFVIKLPDNKDPGDLSRDEINILISKQIF